MAKDSYYVLCVDDEPGILESLSEIVSAAGFTPLTAPSSTAAEALLAAHHRKTALILCDYNLPGINGLEFRRNTLESYRGIPFVLVSGFITREDALKGVELQVAGFVEKPFSAGHIESAVKEKSTLRIASLKEDEELQQGFVADAENLLEEMESLLLSLEAAPDDLETINRIFAIAHTIKGASGFFQPKTIHRFTHAFEDFLSPFKKQQKALTPEALAVLLQGLDTIKGLLKTFAEGHPGTAPVEELTEIFLAENTSRARDPEKSASPRAARAPNTSPRDEVKVPFAVLDEFMELSSEIIVIRNMINKIVKSVEKETPGNRNVVLLSELLDEMHKINGQMQDKVVDLRKVGCKSLFRPLKRAVHDLARSLGKEIDFITVGDSLRIDTAVAEVLSNSLIHMVRNCADHGIESPAERTARGKHSTGTISVEAKETNQEIQVIVSDDGKGIDPEVIRRKVVEKSLRSQEQAASMGEQELFSMIFESGFSTAAQVTDVSGRGVGMDMVKKAVSGIGGKIELSSTPGKGSEIRLIIPVPKMVTIINSLMVRAGTHWLAIPQDSLLRLIRFEGAEIEKVLRKMEGADFLDSGGELLPALNLEAALNPNGGGSRFTCAREKNELSFAVVTCESGRFALSVDEIQDTEDTVVKKLGIPLAEIPFYRGATFLGDGQVGLILNIQGLARHTGIFEHAMVRSSDAGPSNAASTQRSILLFGLSQPGVYGIPLDGIFRLEKLRKSDLQTSGKISTLVYRGAVCPFFPLGEILGFGPEETDPDDGSLSALVFSEGKNFIAFGVRDIIDLVYHDISGDFEPPRRPGVAGIFPFPAGVVTLLDRDQLLAMALSRLIKPELPAGRNPGHIST